MTRQHSAWRITGTVRINGELIVNDIVFSTHKHTGVQPGGGTSTGPTN
jgi:phage baseplate assembly protein gpV